MFQQILFNSDSKKKKNDFDQTIEFQIFEFPFYKTIPYFYFFSRRYNTKLYKKRSILIRQDLHHSFRNNYHIISC